MHAGHGPDVRPARGALHPAVGQRALPKDTIQELWIYKATDKGCPGAYDVSTFGATCPASWLCHTWVPSIDEFRYRDGGWARKTINGCATTSEQVGVHTRVRHAWITGLFGSSTDLEDHAVFTFEPLPTLTCTTRP